MPYKKVTINPLDFMKLYIRLTGEAFSEKPCDDEDVEKIVWEYLPAFKGLLSVGHVMIMLERASQQYAGALTRPINSKDLDKLFRRLHNI